MNQSQLEEVVVYCNICLKRWARLGNRAKFEDVRGLIIQWIVRHYRDQYRGVWGTKWRGIKGATKEIRNSIYFTYAEGDDPYITSILFKEPVKLLPVSYELDFEELNRRARQLKSYPASVPEISFKEIEQIKF